jgi:hypothetical protein
MSEVSVQADSCLLSNITEAKINFAMPTAALKYPTKRAHSPVVEEPASLSCRWSAIPPSWWKTPEHTVVFSDVWCTCRDVCCQHGMSAGMWPQGRGPYRARSQKLRKGTISFIMQVCLFVRMTQLGSDWRDFSWNITFEKFSNIF